MISVVKVVPAEFDMNVFYQWTNGLVFGIEHVSFKTGNSILVYLGFIVLHLVIFNKEEE